MKTVSVRWLAITAAVLLAMSASVATTGCGNNTAPELVDENNNSNTDGGTTTDGVGNDTNSNNNNSSETTPDGGPDNTVTENQPDNTVTETTPEGPICPPGCGTCTQPDPNNLELGKECEVKEGKDPCDQSKGLICAPFGQSKDKNPAGTCLVGCTDDEACGKIRAGLKCLEFTAGQATQKACALRNKAGDPCNANEQVYCESGNVCLISSADGSGTCIKECSNTAECPKGQVCRQAVASNARTFCLEPVLAGPKCIGDACDVTNRSTNCLDGLICFQGICVKPCDKKNSDGDCDTSRGESCYKRLFSSDPAYCRAKPTVTKAGEACNTTSKLCDDTKGLRCINAICVKTCDPSKGEQNNPDCSEVPNAACRQSQLSDGSTINLCQTESKVNGRCGVGFFCPKGTRCINLQGRDYPTCFVDCEPCEMKQNSSGSWVHSKCDSGTSPCQALTFSDGRPAGGVCIPSGDPVLGEGEVCSDPNKGCKENLLCVRFGTSPNSAVCSKRCEPSKGAEKNPDCGGGRCGQLSNGGGVCFPQGKKVYKEGEFCGDDLSKSCLDGLTCVTFSNDEAARGICSKNCDPNGDASECASGQCGRLTNGSGVCFPQLKRSQKSGEKCRGPMGTPHANDCLEKDGNNKLVCAPEGDASSNRYCMIACDPANGLNNNSNCTKAGLTNHFCLPDKTRPDLGACVEKCTFTNRLRCETSKCQYGTCQEKLLDSQRGLCLTADDEKKCKERGGTCVNKTCQANACL